MKAEIMTRNVISFEALAIALREEGFKIVPIFEKDFPEALPSNIEPPRFREKITKPEVELRQYLKPTGFNQGQVAPYMTQYNPQTQRVGIRCMSVNTQKPLGWEEITLEKALKEAKRHQLAWYWQLYQKTGYFMVRSLVCSSLWIGSTYAYLRFDSESNLIVPKQSFIDKLPRHTSRAINDLLARK